MVNFALVRLVSPHGLGIAAGAAVGLALSALAITQALATASVFSGILDGLSPTALVLPLLILAAALLLRPVGTASRELVAHHVASRMKRRLRGRILDHETARGPFAPGTERIGSRHALLVDGVENLEPYVTRYLPQVLVTGVTAVVTVGILIAIDPVVGVVAGATALLVPFIPRLWDRALKGRGEEHWGAYSALHADVVDAMRGMETLKLLGAAGRRRDELDRASDSLLAATLRQVRLSLVESGLTGFLLVAGPALVLTVGVTRVWAGTLAPSALFAVTLIGFEVFRPFRDLSNHWHAGYLGVTVGSRILAELNAPVETAPAPAPQTPPDASIAVELDHVTVRYPGAAHDALHDLTLRVPRGRLTAIVGPSGAGKSTVANTILGLLAPATGSVALDRIVGVPPVSLVSQDPVIFAGTLRENLTVVAPDSDDASLIDALEQAQAAELVERGLDAPVGDGGALLSGGQRQRVAIARALLRRSPVLLLDEASSALDARRESALLTTLRDAGGAGGARTLVVIAHRLTAIRDADLVVVVDGGQVVEQGGYDELLERRGTLWRLHTAQAEEVAA
ncbi:ABC transporter ATP-binding protein/permease [Microbacterium aquimaris]|uniref:ATP-binding cassette domain-containing protein n=1 Tax=Microbacterium aquimaris TaxID=459816 RepID=A0ABU5N7C7_9MICO|nr:ATP-binding cassette domain-containing protein [Microbacterium aquimaris]MDZ8162013.1 ATP-binding cassette domain-containing protein [Microbacterium aquimaris]